MLCYECSIEPMRATLAPTTSEASAVCVRCGAGVCLRHGRRSPDSVDRHAGFLCKACRVEVAEADHHALPS
ncbi:MAG: DUF2180 family protein [Dehalococcoidia bacterium]